MGSIGNRCRGINMPDYSLCDWAVHCFKSLPVVVSSHYIALTVKIKA